MESPTTAAISSTAAALTRVRCRLAHRRARAGRGSRYTVTGSPASQCSMSSATAPPIDSGPPAPGPSP